MHILIEQIFAKIEEYLAVILSASEVYDTLLSFATEKTSNGGGGGGDNSSSDQINSHHHHNTTNAATTTTSNTCDSGLSTDHLELDEEQFFLLNDLDSIKQHMHSHDQFLREMVDYEQRIKEIAEESKALIESAYPSMDERMNLIQQRSLLMEKFSSLYRTVCDRQARLNDALILLQRKHMDNLKAWLIYAEDKIAEFEEIGTDLESLNRQLDDQQIFRDEIMEQQELVNTLTTLIAIMDGLSTHALSLVRDASDSAVGHADLLDHSDLEDQLQALSEKWKTVCDFVERRGSMLTKVTEKLPIIQNVEERFNQWISSLDRRIEAVQKAFNEGEMTSSFVNQLMKRVQRMLDEMESEYIHYSTVVEEGQVLLDQLEEKEKSKEAQIPIWQEINNKLERLKDIWDERIQQIESLGVDLTAAQRQQKHQMRATSSRASASPCSSSARAHTQDETYMHNGSQCTQATAGVSNNKKTQPASWRVKEWQRDMEDICTFLGRMEDDLGLDDEGNGAVDWNELAVEEQQMLLNDTEQSIEGKRKEIDELITEGKQIIDEVKASGNQVKQITDINQLVEERWLLIKEELDRKRIKVKTVNELHKFNCEAESLKRALSSHQKWLQGAECSLNTETDLQKLEDQTRLRNRSLEYQKKKVEKLKHGIQLICTEAPQLSDDESLRDIKYFINFWESINERSNQLQKKIESKSCELKGKQESSESKCEEETSEASRKLTATSPGNPAVSSPTCTDNACNDEADYTTHHAEKDSDVEYDEITSQLPQIVLPSRHSGAYEVHQVLHKSGAGLGEENPAYSESEEEEEEEDEEKKPATSSVQCVQNESKETRDEEGVMQTTVPPLRTDGSLDQISHDLDNLLKSCHVSEKKNETKSPKSHEVVTCTLPARVVESSIKSQGEKVYKNVSQKIDDEFSSSPVCMNENTMKQKSSTSGNEKTNEKVIYDVPQKLYREVNIHPEKSIARSDKVCKSTAAAAASTGDSSLPTSRVRSNFTCSIESDEVNASLHQPFSDAKSNSDASSFSVSPTCDRATPLLSPSKVTEAGADDANSKQFTQSHEQISSPCTSNEDATSSYEKSAQASHNAPLYGNNVSEGESEWEYRANPAPAAPAPSGRKNSLRESNDQQQQQQQVTHSKKQHHSKHSSVMYHHDSSSSSRSSVSPAPPPLPNRNTNDDDDDDRDVHREASVIVLRRSGNSASNNNNTSEHLIIKSNRSGSRGDSSISSSESDTNCHLRMHMPVASDTPVAASTSSSFSVARPAPAHESHQKCATLTNINNSGMIQHSLLAVATDSPFERSIIPSTHVPYYVDHLGERTQWDHPVMSQLIASLVEFNEIRFSAYRTGLKLKEVRRYLCLDLVPLSLLSETFDRYCLRAQNDRLLTVPEMITCLQSIFETAISVITVPRERTLMKVPLVIDLTLNWLLNLFDTASRTGLVRVLSFKVALVTLCDAPLLDKYNFMFKLIAHEDGFTDTRKFGLLLHDLIQIPRFLGEAAYFGGSNIEPSVRSCFTRDRSGRQGDKNTLRSEIESRDFLSWLNREPQSLVWLSVMHRLAAAETIIHQVKCNICKSYPISGLRYRCLRCFNFDSCQICFLTDRVAVKHNPSHPMQEYCLPTSSSKDLSDFSRILRNKLVKRSKKSPKFGYLPVQTVLEGDDLESPSVSLISSPDYDFASIPSPDESPVHQVNQTGDPVSFASSIHLSPFASTPLSPHLSTRPPVYPHRHGSNASSSFGLPSHKVIEVASHHSASPGTGAAGETLNPAAL